MSLPLSQQLNVENLQQLSFERSKVWGNMISTYMTTDTEGDKVILMDDFDTVFKGDEEPDEYYTKPNLEIEAEVCDISDDDTILKDITNHSGGDRTPKSDTLVLVRDNTTICLDKIDADLLNHTRPLLAEEERLWKETGIDNILNTFDSEKIEEKVGGWLRLNHSSYSLSNNSLTPFNDLSEGKRSTARPKMPSNLSWRPNKPTETDTDSLHSDDTARYIRSSRKRKYIRQCMTSSCSTTMTIKTFCSVKSKREELHRKYACAAEHLDEEAYLHALRKQREKSCYRQQLIDCCKKSASDQRKIEMGLDEQSRVIKRRYRRKHQKLCHRHHSSNADSSSSSLSSDDLKEPINLASVQRRNKSIYTSHRRRPFASCRVCALNNSYSSSPSHSFCKIDQRAMKGPCHRNAVGDETDQRPRMRESECCCRNDLKLCKNAKHFADTSTDELRIVKICTPKKRSKNHSNTVTFVDNSELKSSNVKNPTLRSSLQIKRKLLEYSDINLNSKKSETPTLNLRSAKPKSDIQDGGRKPSTFVTHFDHSAVLMKLDPEEHKSNKYFRVNKNISKHSESYGYSYLVSGKKTINSKKQNAKLSALSNDEDMGKMSQMSISEEVCHKSSPTKKTKIRNENSQTVQNEGKKSAKKNLPVKHHITKKSLKKVIPANDKIVKAGESVEGKYENIHDSCESDKDLSFLRDLNKAIAESLRLSEMNKRKENIKASKKPIMDEKKTRQENSENDKDSTDNNEGTQMIISEEECHKSISMTKTKIRQENISQPVQNEGEKPTNDLAKQYRTNKNNKDVNLEMGEGGKSGGGKLGQMYDSNKNNKDPNFLINHNKTTTKELNKSIEASMKPIINEKKGDESNMHCSKGVEPVNISVDRENDSAVDKNVVGAVGVAYNNDIIICISDDSFELEKISKPQPKSFKLKKLKKLKNQTDSSVDTSFLISNTRIYNSTALTNNTTRNRTKKSNGAVSSTNCSEVAQRLRPQTLLKDAIEAWNKGTNCSLVSSATVGGSNPHHLSTARKDIIVYRPTEDADSIVDAGFITITEEHLKGIIGEKKAQNFIKYYTGVRRFSRKATVYYSPPVHISESESDSDDDSLEKIGCCGNLYQLFIF